MCSSKNLKKYGGMKKLQVEFCDAAEAGVISEVVGSLWPCQCMAHSMARPGYGTVRTQGTECESGCARKKNWILRRLHDREPVNWRNLGLAVSRLRQMWVAFHRILRHAMTKSRRSKIPTFSLSAAVEFDVLTYVPCLSAFDSGSRSQPYCRRLGLAIPQIRVYKFSLPPYSQ